jgi:hypothetical protein
VQPLLQAAVVELVAAQAVQRVLGLARAPEPVQGSELPAAQALVPAVSVRHPALA